MEIIKKYYTYISILFIVSTLCSCTRIIDWATCTFYQGESFDNKERINSVKSSIRSITVYDQFATQAHFDALWLSDNVRNTYIDLHVGMLGKSENQKNILLKRQLDENKQFILFFVLCPYEIPLNDPQCDWKVFIEVEGAHFDPIELKTIELLPIYRLCFGKIFNRFKAVYQIKFDAKDVQDISIITAHTKKIVLHFRSATKESQLCWHINQDIVDSNDVHEKRDILEMNSATQDQEEIPHVYTTRLRKKRVNI